MDHQDTKLTVHDNIWHFTVSDPQLHKNKFTIYKVTCKTFPIKSPEVLTEIVCWKRYNDFKTLYKALSALHKALHRRNPFPEFAKPKLFGRFDDTVIEERRQSALNLLNFVSGQPHLYKSLVFRQFIDDGGKSKSNPNHKQAPFVLRSSSTLDVLSGESSQSDGKPPPDLVPIIAHHTDKEGSQDNVDLSPDVAMENKETSDSKPSESLRPADYRVSEVLSLEGTWNYPQVADNISLGSSTGDETVDTDEDSVMAHSLPEPELAFFDPMSSPGMRSSSEGQEPHMTTSNSWLLTGLNMCAEMETDVVDGAAVEKLENDDDEQKDHRSNTDISSSSTLLADSSRSSTLASDSVKDDVEQEFLDSLEDFDPLRKMSDASVASKIECGKGDLDLSDQWESNKSGSFSSSYSSSKWGHSATVSDSTGKAGIGIKNQSSHLSWRSQSLGSDTSHETDAANRNNTTPSHSGKGLLHKLMSKSPKRSRTNTEQSVSTMDLGGKEDYIYLAASQISMAQNSEANGDFEVAFAYYKSGVGILLQGVQGDSNKSRRDAVRRKTAQYLMKAEDLFNRHLSSEDVDERRWGVDSYLSPSLDLDPSLAFIRGSVKELRSYQVLGIVDKVILIRDKGTDETFVIKSIHKSPAPDLQGHPNILPTSCPFMVSLHKFYETDNAIYLLLQYANGGKLWTYIGDYLSGERSLQAGNQMVYNVESKNIYSGCKLETGGDGDSVSDGHQNQNGTEICLSRILPKEEVGSGDNSQPVQSSEMGGAVRFSSVKRSDANKELNVENLSNDDYSSVDGIKIVDNRIDKEPLDRRLSSLSDDSSRVYDADSSALTPSSPFHDEDHFQTLLQEHRTNLEGFSINSIDSEDNRRLSSACFERIDSIAEDQEPEMDAAKCVGSVNGTENPEVFRQSSEDSVFSSSEASRLAPTFNSFDIVQSSKQLLKEVDKVLYETDHGKENPKEGVTSNSSQDSTVENPNSATSSELEEPSIYDSNRYSEEDSSDPSISDKKPSSPTDNTDSFQDKNHTPGGEECKKRAFSEADVISRPRLNSASAIFRQTSTPHKLSIARMNSKEMTRSASFECDLRSPTRNRGRTVADLFERLDSTSQEQVRIPETSIRKWMANIVTAVSRLHSLGIVCRDLNPRNILLSDGGMVYLTYFCHLGYGDHGLDWEAVNDLYAAPEVQSIAGYNMSCDWWSIGALLFELVVGRSLRDCHPGGINSHTCLHIPAFVSDEARGLLDGLLTYNPKERLGSGMAGAEEIKAHPFFNGVDWHVLESS